MKVSVVEAMAEVQCQDKPKWIKNCSHFEDHFTNRMFKTFAENEELRLVLDGHDITFWFERTVPNKEAGGTECCVLPHYLIDAHSASSDEKPSFTCQDKDGAGRPSGTEDFWSWGSGSQPKTSSCRMELEVRVYRDERRFFHTCKATMKTLTRRLFYMLLTPHPEVRVIFGYISPTSTFSSWFLDIIQAYTRTPCSSQAEGGTIEIFSFIQSIEL